MDISGFQKIIAFFVSLITAISGWLGIATRPMGKEVDLTDYKLVFSDEFEGDSLDLDAWRYNLHGAERGGFNGESQVAVKDGNLVMTGEYLENGAYGPGWYGADIALNQKYCRGYFEVRCICNDKGGFWSAFWIQADHPYEHDISRGGPGGAEIDIMEAMDYDEVLPSNRDAILHTIHVNGSDDDPEKIESKRLGHFRGNDIYRSYNTYGLEWTENEYIFYVNGKETARSSFANGVSEVPETVRVSLCIPDEITMKQGEKTQFIVDYVKIYQKQG
ncbi:MAG: glycoside hydrolase family 16 protein [Clostridia bacterium]|nr:glycoside hydrolase family 16 protein [Clostridia bacterium]